MPPRTPSVADTTELAQLAAENLSHHVWCETTYDGIRYIARGHDLGIHPYSLVAKSLAELRAGLSTPQHPADPTPIQP